MPPDVSVTTGREKYTVDKIVANILFCFVKEIGKRFTQISNGNNFIVELYRKMKCIMENRYRTLESRCS